MDRTIFYQNNESAINMEKNGLRSCGYKSRHIKIRYYFIKDILENEYISLEHCRTELMLVDFLTKTLQGSVLRRRGASSWASLLSRLRSVLEITEKRGDILLRGDHPEEGQMPVRTE